MVLYSGVHYGVIEKIFTFEDIDVPSCFVSLSSHSIDLYSDDITHANIASLDSMWTSQVKIIIIYNYCIKPVIVHSW